MKICMDMVDIDFIEYLVFTNRHVLVNEIMLEAVNLSLSKCIQNLIYTETIKLCPLDVYACQFQMYERISFKFSHYQL